MPTTTEFTALKLFPGTACPDAGSSIIDNWTPSTSNEVLVRGFTLSEIMAVLWNMYKMRVDTSAAYDYTYNTETPVVVDNTVMNESFLVDYTDSYDGTSTYTIPEPYGRVCNPEHGGFFFTQGGRQIFSGSDRILETQLDVGGILQQGTEYALVMLLDIGFYRASWYLDSVYQGLIYTRPLSIRGPQSAYTTTTATIFGKSATVGIDVMVPPGGSFSSLSASLTVSNNESYTY